MTVRILDSTTINRIAAGEVVERPASAVKELVENALDAGSTQINVSIRDGGQSLIVVQDNGSGMSRNDLELSIERHATSKLPNDDLMDIHTMGFRGEALPSIGSVSRLSITSHDSESSSSWLLSIEGGIKQPAEPANLNEGTVVEVRDLFFATPARLKFLRTPKTEQGHIVDILNKLAMANPTVAFSLRDETRTIINHPTAKNLNVRLQSILGKEFTDNSLAIEGTRDNTALSGYVGLPTLHRSTAQHQYLFVNGRPVTDRLLTGAVRAAYADLVAKSRHPMLVLSLTIDTAELDVNVHPAKTEVRFQDPKSIRSLIVSTVRHHLTQVSHLTSSTIHQSALDSIKVFDSPLQTYQRPLSQSQNSSTHFPAYSTSKSFVSQPFVAREAPSDSSVLQHNIDSTQEIHNVPEKSSDGYLGHAVAQIYDTYIIAQTHDDVIIVDQHAAHERLVYESMKQQLEKTGIKRQSLLIPTVVDLADAQREQLLQHLPALESLGLIVEPFGISGIQVKEIPALLSGVDAKVLILDIVDLLFNMTPELVLKERVFEILAERACKGSVKAGRKLTSQEMNQLLKDMEETPFSGQCNHGRPTYVKLGKKDIERLFGRA